MSISSGNFIFSAFGYMWLSNLCFRPNQCFMICRKLLSSSLINKKFYTIRPYQHPYRLVLSSVCFGDGAQNPWRPSGIKRILAEFFGLVVCEMIILSEISGCSGMLDLLRPAGHSEANELCNLNPLPSLSFLWRRLIYMPWLKRPRRYIRALFRSLYR